MEPDKGIEEIAQRYNKVNIDYLKNLTKFVFVHIVKSILMKSIRSVSAILFCLILSACSVHEMASDNPYPQVHISARIEPSIITKVTEDGTSFSDGDAIQVQNMNRKNMNLAKYTYSASTGKWNTTDKLYWEGNSENTFHAWYPTTATYDSFTIPSDQTDGTSEADWMTASTAARRPDGKVRLSFSHNLAKVSVMVDGWTNEYTDNERVINRLDIKSISSIISRNETIYGDNVSKWIKTCPIKANSIFNCIIAPGKYETGTDIMMVYVNSSGTPLSVKTSSEIEILPGKAYNFRLNIGKTLATITSSVSVGDWEDENLDDQQAVITGPAEPADIAYTLSQGYASEGTLNNNAPHRVKTNLIYGSFSIKVNEGYVIRAIYTYPTEKVSSDFTCILANCTDRTEMDVMNEGRYAVITFANGSDPNGRISPTEDIVKSLTKYEMEVPDYPGCPYINSAVFFGDSIMHGVYSYFETGTDGKILRKNGFDSHSYNYLRIPDYFGLMADAAVTNNAKRGSGWITDTRNLGNALEMANKTDFSKYDFAAFCLGINDWIQGAQIGSIENPGTTGGSISEGTVVANMTACFEKVRRENPSCRIVVYSPYISWGQYSDGGDYTSKTYYGDESTDYALGALNKAGYTLQELIDVIDQVCRYYGIRHVPLSKSKVCTKENVKDIMIDGLHPSREIRPDLAEEIFAEAIKDQDDDSGVNMNPEEGNM